MPLCSVASHRLLPASTSDGRTTAHLHRRKAAKMQYFRYRRSSKTAILQISTNFAPFRSDYDKMGKFLHLRSNSPDSAPDSVKIL